MIKDCLDTTCPYCGQSIKVFVKADGTIAVGFYNIEDQAQIVELLKTHNIELGIKPCGKEDKNG